MTLMEWGIVFFVGIVGLFFLSRIRKENIGNIVSTIRSVVVGSMLFLFFSATLSMGFFDVIAGGGGAFLLTNKSIFWSSFISLSTTGVLLVTILLRGNDDLSKKLKITKEGRLWINIVMYLVMGIDVVLDSLFADYLGFGRIMGISIPPIHWVFRILIGALSLVGEHVSLSIAFKFEDIEGLFMDILPSLEPKPKGRSNTNKQASSNKNNNQNNKKESPSGQEKTLKHRPQFQQDRNGKYVPSTQTMIGKDRYQQEPSYHTERNRSVKQRSVFDDIDGALEPTPQFMRGRNDTRETYG